MTRLLVLLLCSLPLTAAPLRLLVVDKPANALLIIDPVSHEVVTRVPVGTGPHEVAACKEGKLAVVSNYGNEVAGSTLSIIDVASGKEVKRASVAPLLRPHGLACSAKTLYFTSEASLAVGRFDLDELVFDQVVGTGQKLSHMVVFDPGRKALYTANILSGSVTSLVPASGGARWEVTQIAVPPGPEGIDVSPDGAQVWVAHRPHGGISAIDAVSGKVTANLPVETFAFRLRFTPDGRYALATEPEGNRLLVFDAKTRALVKAIAIDGNPVSVAVDHAGKHAYVAAASTGEVVVIDLATLAITDRVSSGGHPDGMALAE
jgi:YVTN family beta-propeller protein